MRPQWSIIQQISKKQPAKPLLRAMVLRALPSAKKPIALTKDLRKELSRMRFIGQWLSALLVLLLTACSSGNDESQPDSKPVLKIYVFAPDHPIVTRADNGDVDATDVEKKINSLHVWVFEHESGGYVGHISLSNVSLSETAGNEVTMELDDAFANTPNVDKPRVDVYVVANATAANCGISLDATTTREDLDNALIKEDFFGVSNLIKTVPTDGLPNL